MRLTRFLFSTSIIWLASTQAIFAQSAQELAYNKYGYREWGVLIGVIAFVVLLLVFVAIGEKIASKRGKTLFRSAHRWGTKANEDPFRFNIARSVGEWRSSRKK